jgi:hypothetical protein
MKKLLFAVLLVIFVSVSADAFAGRFTFDASVGYGADHAGMGAKLTLGQLVFGSVGMMEGETLWKAGIQVPFKFSNEEKFTDTFYISASYGGIGVKTESYYNASFESVEKTAVINGFTGMLGYYWGFKSGIFLNIAGGFCYGKTVFFEGTPEEQKVTLSGLAIDLGIGYRFN